MSRTRAEVGELAAKAFDRLERDFPGCQIEDALLAVELSDPDDTRPDDGDGHPAPATVIVLESTTDRSVVHAGIVAFVQANMFNPEADDG